MLQGHAGLSAWKGAVAGAVGGLIGSVLMDQLQGLLCRAMKRQERERAIREERWWQRRVSEAHRPESPEQGEPAAQPVETGSEARVSAELADAVALRLFNRPLSDAEKRIWGPILSYLYGTALGAGYGAASAARPLLSAGVGVPFGAAIWLVQDELAAPLLGLSKPAREYPASSHVITLGAHCVYGLTTESIRRALLRLMR